MADVEAEGPKPKRGVSLYVLLAILLAAALGGAFAALSGDEITDPAQFREHGAQWAAGMEFAFALGIALVSALIAWLLFFVLIFRKRAGFWKNVLIAAVMLPVVILIVVPIRIVSFTSSVDEDRAAMQVWKDEAGGRIHAIRERFNNDTAAFPVARIMPPLERPADVASSLEKLRQLRARYGAYEQEMEQELRNSREALTQLDVFEGEKTELYAYYDRLLAPESDVQRHFDLTREMLDRQIEGFTFLNDHRGAWTLVDGRVQFYERGGYEQFDAIMRPLIELDSNLDRVEGSLNALLGRPGEDRRGAPPTAPAGD